MRILAVDPGEKRIGLAISDPTGTLARPLGVIVHISRPENARLIAAAALQHQAEMILIGFSATGQDAANESERRAQKLAAALRRETRLPVKLWDESFSTQEARRIQIELGTPQKKRQGHLDDKAAAIILQDYLDSHRENPET